LPQRPKCSWSERYLGIQSRTGQRPGPKTQDHSDCILTANAVERFGASSRDFMSAYEMVSEGAHPNYVGTVESYQRADTKTGICELIDSPVHRDPERIAIPLDFLAGALLIAASAVRDWESSRDTLIALLPQYQPPPMPEPKRKQDEAIGSSGS
jgi:hypothetical protein